MSEMGGIRSTVEFSPPVDCPVAEASTNVNGPIRTARSSIPAEGGPTPVLEFVCNGEPADIEDVTTIFSIGTLNLCRIDHRGNPLCPCSCLGNHGIPITRYHVDDGHVTVVFYSKDFDELRTVMDELQTHFPSLNVKRLVREPDDYRDDQYVLVDTGKLTDRQLEMLNIAYDQGYFDRPRGANATEIARELEIDPSTFREHVNIALSKLLESILEIE